MITFLQTKQTQNPICFKISQHILLLTHKQWLFSPKPGLMKIVSFVFLSCPCSIQQKRCFRIQNMVVFNICVFNDLLFFVFVQLHPISMHIYSKTDSNENAVLGVIIVSL